MIKELREGIWWLRFTGLPTWHVNAYLVDDGDDVTLIDSGLPWNIRTLHKHLQSAGYHISDIDQVLMTHYDMDHFGGLLWLYSKIDAPIYSGKTEALLFGGQHKPQLIHHKGLVHRLLSTVLPHIPVNGVNNGDTIGNFTAYHAPGHNPDHMVYVHDTLDAAFLGDLVREENGELRKPVFWDNYDRRQVRASIATTAKHTPDFDLACPGHGNPVEVEGSKQLSQLAKKVLQ